MAAKYWTCPKCGTRNERVKQKCAGFSDEIVSSREVAQPFSGDLYIEHTHAPCPGRRPKRRVPKHAETLRDHNFKHYAELNEAIHAAGENCGVCGTEPKDGRNLQREHDHTTGLPRGLACWRCNRLMPKQFTLVEARAIVAYLERVEVYHQGEASGV